MEIGRKTMFGIGKEAVAWGTKAASISWFPVEEFNFNPKIETTKNESALGRIETVFDSQISKKWAEPSISGVVYDKLIGFLLHACYGSLTTTPNSPETGVHTHDWIVKNDNAHPSFTLVFKDGTHTKMVTGAFLNTLEFSVEAGQFAKFSASFVGKFPETTTDSPSYTEENPFTAKHAVMKYATDLAGLGAASAVAFSSAKVSFEKNAEAHFVLGSTAPTAILNKQFSCAGDFSMVFDAETYFDFFANQTEKAIRFSFVNTDVTIGLVTNPSLTLDFAKANFEDWGKETGLGDKVMQSFAFNPQYSLSDGKMTTGQLINAQTAY